MDNNYLTIEDGHRASSEGISTRKRTSGWNFIIATICMFSALVCLGFVIASMDSKNSASVLEELRGEVTEITTRRRLGEVGGCDPSQWNHVKAQCNDGCQALVISSAYGGICEDYCQAHGLQCAEVKEDTSNNCVSINVGETAAMSCTTDARLFGAGSDYICVCEAATTGTGSGTMDGAFFSVTAEQEEFEANGWNLDGVSNLVNNWGPKSNGESLSTGIVEGNYFECCYPNSLAYVTLSCASDPCQGSMTYMYWSGGLTHFNVKILPAGSSTADMKTDQGILAIERVTEWTTIEFSWNDGDIFSMYTDYGHGFQIKELFASTTGTQPTPNPTPQPTKFPTMQTSMPTPTPTPMSTPMSTVSGCDPSQWNHVKAQCDDGCQALVISSAYGGICEDYCQAHGLQCAEVKEDTSNNCVSINVGETAAMSCTTDARLFGAGSDYICVCEAATTGTGSGTMDGAFFSVTAEQEEFEANGWNLDGVSNLANNWGPKSNGESLSTGIVEGNYFECCYPNSLAYVTLSCASDPCQGSMTYMYWSGGLTHFNVKILPAGSSTADMKTDQGILDIKRVTEWTTIEFSWNDGDIFSMYTDYGHGFQIKELFASTTGTQPTPNPTPSPTPNPTPFPTLPTPMPTVPVFTWVKIDEVYGDRGDRWNEQMGGPIASNKDGSVWIAGVPGFRHARGSPGGAARLHELQESVYKEVKEHKSDKKNYDEKCGKSVAFSLDGNAYAYSRYQTDRSKKITNTGAIQVYRKIDGNFKSLPLIEGWVTGDRLDQVQLSADGLIVAFMGRKSNEGILDKRHVRVYMYDSESNDWEQLGETIQEDIYTSNDFGNVIKLSADGYTIAVNDPYSGEYGQGIVYVYTYDLTEETWKLKGDAIVGQTNHEKFGFGYSIAIDALGNRIAITGICNSSTNNVGCGVQVFDFDGSTWTQTGGKITFQEDEYLGYALSFSADGSVLVVGGSNGNIVYTYTYHEASNAWVSHANPLDGYEIDTRNIKFGKGLHISADASTLFVGAPYEYVNRKTKLGMIVGYKTDYKPTNRDCLGVWGLCEANCKQKYQILVEKLGDGTDCQITDGKEQECNAGLC